MVRRQNLPQRYKGLSAALVIARKNKMLPYEWIVDDYRWVINIKWNGIYRSPRDYAMYNIDNLISLPDRYIKEYLPRWYKQPKYVEVWIEKSAMASLFSEILSKSREVLVVPNGG